MDCEWLGGDFNDIFPQDADFDTDNSRPPNVAGSLPTKTGGHL